MASTSSLRRPCRKLLGPGRVCMCRGWDPLSADDVFCDACECHVSFHEPLFPIQSGIGRCLKAFGNAGLFYEDGCQEFYHSDANPKRCEGCGCHVNIHEEVVEPGSKRPKLDAMTISEVVEHDKAHVAADTGLDFESAVPLVDGKSIRQCRDYVLESKHKVFISHSGVYKDFVDQLCYDLERCDRYPFFDKRRHSLPIGENFPNLIFEAIKKCQIGVLILSQEYFTRTKWPMLELVHMMKMNELRKRNQNLEIKIIPIFFHMSISKCRDPLVHVQWISQWETWAKTDKRINIEEWKKALNVFRPTNGLVFNSDKGEVEVRAEIIDAICGLIPPETRWDDSHVQGRIRFCKAIWERINQIIPSFGIRIVGLYGMGGIGKTTICKALCNYICTKFHDKVCHVELNCQSEEEVLKEVLKKLSNMNHELLNKSNIGVSRGYIKNGKFDRKVLLIIDNVYDGVIEQAKVYLRGHYEEGSVIIFTARSLDVLSKCLYIKESDCLDGIEILGLKEDEARSLFLHHLKHSPYIKQNVNEQLITSCLKKSLFLKGNGNGSHYHPLGLKVLGSAGYYSKISLEQFQDNVDTFNPLQIPKHPIFSILRTSYDTLLHEDQLLFMDVAIFVPKYLNNIHKHWNIIKWLSMMHGLSVEKLMKRLENLKRKFVLESVGDGHTVICMHDLWIEFCVAETKEGKVEDRCWIRLEEESVELEEKHSWKNMKRMFFINNGWKSLDRTRLKCFSNVTVLKLVGEFNKWDQYTLDLSGLELLKSLELDPGWDFIYNNSIKDYGLGSLKNLVFLTWIDMPTSEKCIEKIGCLTKLQVLKLPNYKGKGLPDVSKLTSLELICFANCTKVQSIVGLNSKLSNLQSITLNECKLLQSIHGVGDLIALEELDLENCSKLKMLPSHLPKLTSLRMLNLKGCKSIQLLPGLCDLVALEELEASNCESLIELPNIQKLTKLRKLSIRGTTLIRTVPGLEHLVSLEELNANFSKLTDLDLWPDLSKLQLLRYIDIFAWNGAGLASIINLTMLEKLVVFGCALVDVLPNLQNLTRLQSLSFYHSDFKNLQELCKVTNLQILTIIGCHELETLSNMHMLIKLKSLDLTWCRSWESLHDTHIPSMLKTLKIKQCKYCEMILRLDKPGHKDLNVLDCNDILQNWSIVSNLTSLEMLEVEGFANTKIFPDMNRLINLRSLKLIYGGYETVPGIICLSELETLKFCSMENISEVPDLSNFPRLNELKLYECKALKSLTSSEPLTTLGNINLGFCSSLKEIPDLSNFPYLEALSLDHCEQLISIVDSNGHLHLLRRLKLTGCRNLEVLPDYLSNWCIRKDVMFHKGTRLWMKNYTGDKDFDSNFSNTISSSESSDANVGASK